MKKKTLAVFALAAALAAVPTFSFAAGPSPEVDDDEETVMEEDSIKPGTGVSGTSEASAAGEIHVGTDGTLLYVTGNTVDKSGTNIGLVFEITTSTGAVTSNHNGSVSVSTLKVHFANGEAETAGLPADAVEKISRLNRGEAAADVVGAAAGADLTGYIRVGNTRAVIASDAATGLTGTKAEIVFYIDSVDTSEMIAVYYDNNTGRWVVVPVVADPATRTVKITVPGSCTVQLLKKAAV